MITRLKLKPGQKGTKNLVAQYGDALVCVRYRYDSATCTRNPIRGEGHGEHCVLVPVHRAKKFSGLDVRDDQNLSMDEANTLS